ncbi:hypothetical protein HMPREF9444_01640 [Succinatimonas hippei YIT 12066]|uniref:Uncharacterized protein n=1 Tax=Succinatimonas hippei (strain DSM 22608 / JCM 16073 / KCTC 15190 / YIT 12066) TaxID=762983 RepID=E8LLP1_SUCHY|nr:hypothetical protein HMPREF9444_01640 [Succinatimonas hippei YIT 12066]
MQVSFIIDGRFSFLKDLIFDLTAKENFLKNNAKLIFASLSEAKSIT